MEANFDALLSEESPDAAILVTLEGIVLHWNRGAEHIFGYGRTETLGRSLNDLVVPLDRYDEERQILRHTLETGWATFESLRQRKDGSLVYVDISGVTGKTVAASLPDGEANGPPQAVPESGARRAPEARARRPAAAGAAGKLTRRLKVDG